MQKGLRSFSNQKLTEAKELSKMAYKSQSTRENYRKLYEWSKKQLSDFEVMLQHNQDNEISGKVLEGQKKVIISMLLEISRIARQQCVEKGQIFQELLNYAIQFMNQHQKNYDMLSYTQIKHFRDSISDLEKEYYQKNQQLRDNINVLTADKDHRWRNIFMVVKDNRVLRRQKAKLLRKHKQEVWRTKQLEEDLINVRSQNQKYKIMCEEYKLKENQLKNYITNQLLLLHLDEKVKQYPGRARRLLKKELLNCEINELNTLEEKIKFIIQAMEQNNEVCEQFDDWDDYTSTTRLFYNVSVQTYIEMESVAVNTIAPVVQKKIYQSTKSQTRRDLIVLKQVSKNIDLKILPIKKNLPERKKTQQLSLSMSRFKRRGSITSANYNEPVNQSFTGKLNQSSGFKDRLRLAHNVFSLKLTGVKSAKANNFNSTVPNLQSQFEQSGSRVKQDQNLNSQILLSRRIQKKPNKFKNYPKKDQERNFDKKQHIQNMKMCNLILQLYYKPKPKTSARNSKKWQNLQQSLHLQEKQFENEVTSTQGDAKISDKNTILPETEKLVKSIENKYLVNKNKINQVSNTDQKHRNFPILQVQQATSTHTLQSETHKLDNLSFDLEDIKQNQKTCRIGGGHSNKLEAFHSPKMVHQELKGKLWIFQNRHKRQKTDNLEFGKSKFKAKQFIKCQQLSNEVKIKPDEAGNKIRIRNSKIYKVPQSQRKQISRFSNVSTLEFQDHKRVNKMQMMQEKRTMKNEKLLQKFTNSIFMKRKDIIMNPQSMRVFAHHFLLSIFENNKTNHYVNKIRPQALFYSSIKNVDQKQAEMLYACLLIEHLLPTQRYQLFAQDMMVLFAIMLDKLNSMGVLNGFSSLFHVPYQYAIKTVQYLCSIYLSPSQSLDFILSNIRNRKDEPKALNMVQCFLKLYLHLDKIVFQSELWQFLDKISRWSVDGLSDTELNEFFTLIRLTNAQSQSHFKQLNYYTAKNFPLHRFCLYAHRFQWDAVYRIKTWIQTKYLDFFGIYSFTGQEAENLCSQIQPRLANNSKKFNYLLRIWRQMQFKHHQLGVDFDQNFVKLCRMTIALEQIQNQKIHSSNLLIIQNVYRKILRETYICQN